MKWVSRIVIDIPDLEMETCERHTCLKLVTMGCSLLDAMLLFRCRFVTSVVFASKFDLRSIEPKGL